MCCSNFVHFQTSSSFLVHSNFQNSSMLKHLRPIVQSAVDSSVLTILKSPVRFLSTPSWDFIVKFLSFFKIMSKINKKRQSFYNKLMWKTSIQYHVPGFKDATSCLWETVREKFLSSFYLAQSLLIFCLCQTFSDCSHSSIKSCGMDSSEKAKT